MFDKDDDTEFAGIKLDNLNKLTKHLIDDSNRIDDDVITVF